MNPDSNPFAELNEEIRNMPFGPSSSMGLMTRLSYLKAERYVKTDTDKLNAEIRVATSEEVEAQCSQPMTLAEMLNGNPVAPYAVDHTKDMVRQHLANALAKAMLQSEHRDRILQIADSPALQTAKEEDQSIIDDSAKWELEDFAATQLAQHIERTFLTEQHDDEKP